MSKYCLLNGKIEIYDIDKFKDWLFKELQKQEFVGVFNINIDEETEDVTCQKCGKSGEDIDCIEVEII